MAIAKISEEIFINTLKYFMQAIFVGRFQPFHRGHLEAIKWILSREKKISIIIGSLQESFTKDNPFTFKERKEMIEKSLFGAGISNFKIFGVPDFFDDISWAKKILEIAKIKPKEAILFTQNPWTKKCFQKIGVKVKPHPLYFNGLSATRIRKKISKSKRWQISVPRKISDYLIEIKGEERIKFLSVLPEKRIISFIKEEVKRAKARGGIVGVSGGIDSSVVACLTKKSLDKKIYFLEIPFVKNYPSKNNIPLLKNKLKIKVKEIYFGEIYESFLKILPKGDRTTTGNLKPRLRMAALYYFANLFNLLVIGTTNKSELEIGYLTKYGDGGTDIEPLGDLYKTEVIELAKRLKLPEEIIGAIPSADLWSGQTDEKEIGLNYQKLDTLLKLLNQGFKEKEISFLTNIPQRKIKKILERKKKNLHKLSLPPTCKLKF